MYSYISCTYLRTNMYWYVLFASWCTYLVRIICTYTSNTEYVLTNTYFYVFCMYIRTLIRTDSFIPEQKIFVSADDLGRKSWDRSSDAVRVRDWIGTSIAGFIQGTQWRQKQKRDVTLPKPTLFRCQRRKGQGLHPAFSLWLSRTSALEERRFSFSFREQRML